MGGFTSGETVCSGAVNGLISAGVLGVRPGGEVVISGISAGSPIELFTGTWNAFPGPVLFGMTPQGIIAWQHGYGPNIPTSSSAQEQGVLTPGGGVTVTSADHSNANMDQSGSASLKELDSVGDAIWSHQIAFTLFGFYNFTGLALHPSGNYYFVMSGYPETIVSGGITYTGPALAMADASGVVQWAKNASTTGPFGADVHVDGNGRVLLSGSFVTSIDLGGGPLVTNGGNDVAVAALDEQGNHIWSRSYGGVGSDFALLDTKSDDILLAGDCGDTIDFGGGPLGAPGESGLFVAQLDGQGDHVWSKHFGATGTAAKAIGVARDAAGNIYLTAALTAGSIDFGAGPLSVIGTRDLLVAKLDPTGQVIYARQFGAAGTTMQPGKLGVSAAGDVYLVGVMTGVVDFGGGPLGNAGGPAMMYLAVLAP